MRRGLCALLALIALGVLAPVAGGSATGDYTDVRKDFQADGQITPCKFTAGQLTNARRIAQSNPDFAYTGLVSAIDGERSRKCSTALRGLKIVSVKASGRERVVIRNGATKALKPRGTLRNRAGKRVRVRSKRLKRRGRTSVSLPGDFLKNSGDVVRLFDAKGRIVSQYGYGKYRKTPRF